ncbi:unnamed protein product [Haemonchus placei]|uniref:Uncharacterized protein n=1 Tax=Haemonchus placei TaxID=6290 RepID=A0A3P7WL90_HAEPC|nr:unnamed protein product [Haemonchus placei]
MWPLLPSNNLQRKRWIVIANNTFKTHSDKRYGNRPVTKLLPYLEAG